MNIVRVPFRVSLFGGGTDFKHFYSKKNATVISFTIDSYCYISVRELLPFYNKKFRLSWAKIEEEAVFFGQGHSFQIWNSKSANLRKDQSRQRLLKEKKTLRSIITDKQND